VHYAIQISNLINSHSLTAQCMRFKPLLLALSASVAGRRFYTGWRSHRVMYCRWQHSSFLELDDNLWHDPADLRFRWHLLHRLPSITLYNSSSDWFICCPFNNAVCATEITL